MRRWFLTMAVAVLILAAAAAAYWLADVPGERIWQVDAVGGWVGKKLGLTP